MADINMYTFLEHYKDDPVKYSPWKKSEYWMVSSHYLCLQNTPDLLSGNGF